MRMWSLDKEKIPVTQTALVLPNTDDVSVTRGVLSKLSILKKKNRIIFHIDGRVYFSEDITLKGANLKMFLLFANARSMREFVYLWFITRRCYRRARQLQV